MLKQKLQYSGHLMGRAASFEKTLMLGKIDSGRRRGRQRMRWLAVAPRTPAVKGRAMEPCGPLEGLLPRQDEA